MPYRYLEEVATADVAFEAWGETLEEMFIAAADATVNVMVDDLETLAEQVKRPLEADAETVEMLLFAVLQELIYLKDAEGLLLRLVRAGISSLDGGYRFAGEARGEAIDAARHELLADVKAVTLHRFRVEKVSGGWETMVILDV
ncbi:MAG: archease [bacterium]